MIQRILIPELTYVLVLGVYGGSGKVPVGVDANDTNFNTVEKTGGEKTHKITTSEMPTHNHTFTGSEHTHSVGAHAHGLNNHTHSFSSTTSNKELKGGFEVRRYNPNDPTDIIGITATSGTTGVFSRITTAWGR